MTSTGICSSYEQFRRRGKLLKNKLIKHDYQQSRFNTSFCKFYGRYSDHVGQKNHPLGRMLTDVFPTNIWTMIYLLIVHGLFYDKQNNLYKRVLHGAALSDIKNLQLHNVFFEYVQSMHTHTICPLSTNTLNEEQTIC